MRSDALKLEEAIHNWVATQVADHITAYGGSTFGGTSLHWSDNMPDDDPYADYLLADSENIDYILDIEIQLTPVRRLAAVEDKE